MNGTAAFTPGLVLAHGVFDVVHPGHLAYFAKCREMGQKLVVGVTADAYVHKGPGRPMFPAEARADVLRNLKAVDDVRIVDAPSAVPLIQELHPEVYAKGEEYEKVDLAGNLSAERSAVEEYGGRVVFTPTMLGSATSWINRTRNPWPANAQGYVAEIKQHDMGEVLRWFDLAQLQRVVVVGEPIIDEYVYVEPLGKSAKEALVAFGTDGSESWPGGGEIVAKHLEAYSQWVHYTSGGMAPVVKRRFVQPAFSTKVFQTVTVPTGTHPPLLYLPPHDLVVVADFGHGLFPTSDDCRYVLDNGKWVGLTVQSNSANWGFNPVTKWPRANYVVCDQNEAQLAFHERRSGEELVGRLRQSLSADVAAITLGHHGVVLVSETERVRVPALTDRAVDRIGAGDAFLAWTAPFVKIGAPLSIVGLIGSAAAALHVQKRGNPPLDKAEVLGFLKSILA